MFNKSYILALHRVGLKNSKNLKSNSNLIVDPAQLYDFILIMRKKGWKFISIDELVNNLKFGKNPKKVIILSFDDGYLDNYDVGFPLLTNLECPFCIYITTDFINNDPLPWWYKLEEIILYNKKINFLEKNFFYTNSKKNKNLLFNYIRDNLMSNLNSYNSINQWIDETYIHQNINKKNRLFMNWKELKIMIKNNFVTIGSHTLSHPILSHLSNEIVKKELEYSRGIIKDKLSINVEHFAYPFGGPDQVSFRDIDYAKKSGFKSGVVLNNQFFDNLDYKEDINLFKLPRIFYGPGFNNSYYQIKHNLSKIKKIMINYFKSKR